MKKPLKTFEIRGEKWYADVIMSRLHWRAYRYQIGRNHWWFAIVN